MEFIETGVFTRGLEKLLSEEDYRGLQQILIDHPEAGALIRQTGGARKIRWAPRGRGKSGGVRVIYYHTAGTAVCYMLLIYGKHEKDSLTATQKQLLKQVIRDELK